jgi:hypothetical protein
MLTDFIYTAWINAGKPDLGTTRGVTNQLDEELKAYKSNQLIKNGLLLSKKAKTKEED